MVDRLRMNDGVSLNGWETPRVPEGLEPLVQDKYRLVFERVLSTGALRETDLPGYAREAIDRNGDNALSLDSEAGRIYPTFQFDGEGEVRFDIEYSVRVVGSDNMLELIDWWTSPNPMLEGDAPRSLIINREREEQLDMALRAFVATHVGPTS